MHCRYLPFWHLDPVQNFKKSTSPIILEIKEIGADEAQKIVEVNPEWCRNSKTGELLSQDASNRRVLLNVGINIHEYCRFEEINTQAVWLLRLEAEKPEESNPTDPPVESN